jgi:hypothetical protein
LAGRGYLFETCGIPRLGYAEREDRRTWQIIVIPPKKVLKAARA